MRIHHLASTVLIASMLCCVAHAEDPASLFVVRSLGDGTVGLELDAQKETQTTNGVTGPFDYVFQERYRYELDQAIVSASLGVGYRFELFLDVPNILRHQTTRDGFATNLSTGFSDADFGFKYRLFGDRSSTDRMVLRATFTHYSSTVGTDEIALFYAHTFSPEWSVGLQSFYEYAEETDQFGKHYRPDQYGAAALLFWDVKPNLSLIPLIRIYRTDGYENVPSNVTTEFGLEAGWYLSRSWSLTPTLAYLHTSSGQYHDSFTLLNYGVRHGGLASLLLQYQF